MAATWKGTGTADEIKGVELTCGEHQDAGAHSVEQIVGTTYVKNGTEIVAATNQDSLVKVERVCLTLAGSGMTAFIGNTYTVKLSANGQLRADTSLASGTFTNGTQAWVGANVAVADSYLEIGTITITGTNALTYDSVLDINDSADDAGLYFYVSVSPDNYSGEESKTAGTSYGTLAVQSIA